MSALWKLKFVEKLKMHKTLKKMKKQEALRILKDIYYRSEVAEEHAALRVAMHALLDEMIFDLQNPFEKVQ